MMHHFDVFLIEHCPVLLLLVNMALECQKEAGAATQAVFLTWCLFSSLGHRHAFFGHANEEIHLLVLLVH